MRTASNPSACGSGGGGGTLDKSVLQRASSSSSSPLPPPPPSHSDLWFRFISPACHAARGAAISMSHLAGRLSSRGDRPCDWYGGVMFVVREKKWSHCNRLYGDKWDPIAREWERWGKKFRPLTGRASVAHRFQTPPPPPGRYFFVPQNSRQKLNVSVTIVKTDNNRTRDILTWNVYC